MVPNHAFIVDNVFKAGRYDLATHDGLGQFVEAVVLALHAHDPKWGHLRKRSGQTQINGHAEDAALYLSDTPFQSTAVDFVADAGSPTARPTWQPDQPRYVTADWYAPVGPVPILGPAPPPVPIPAPVQAAPRLPGREELAAEGAWLHGFYQAPEGLQRPEGLWINGAPDWEGIGTWLLDVYMGARLAGASREDARADVVAYIQRSREWRAKHPAGR